MRERDQLWNRTLLRVAIARWSVHWCDEAGRACRPDFVLSSLGLNSSWEIRGVCLILSHGYGSEAHANGVSCGVDTGLKLKTNLHPCKCSSDKEDEDREDERFDDALQAMVEVPFKEG